MIRHTCQCGESELLEAGMPPHQCQGCEACGTSYVTVRGKHLPLAPHDWVPHDDKSYSRRFRRRCANCYEREP